MKLNRKKDGAYELDARSYEGPHLYLYVSNALGKMKSGEVPCLIYDDTYSQENLSTGFKIGNPDAKRRRD